MALGGKTVQYTLSVNMETGQLTAASQRVASELNLIQKQSTIASGGMLEFGRSIKQLKSELSLLFLGSFGGYALAVGLLGDALSAAAQKAKEFIFGIQMDSKILEDAKAYAKSLKDAALSQDDIVGGKIREFAAQIELNRVQNENVQNQRAFWTEFAKAFSGRGFDFEQLLDAYKRWRDSSKQLSELTKEQTAEEILKNQWKQATLAMDLRYTKEINELTKEGIELSKQLRASRSEGELLPDSPITEREFFKGRQPFMLPVGGEISGGLPETPVDLNANLLLEAQNARSAAQANRELAEARFIADDSLANAMPLLDLVPTKLETIRMTMSALASGFAEGFAAIGASVVNGTSALGGFGAVFLKMVANLAVQFGTFMILAGMAAQAAPWLGLSGGAAVAAGIALTIFGGALGAIASKMGGSGSRRTSERDQIFRDSRFNTAGGGGTTINNYINFQNTIGLTRDAMKEVGEAVSKEIFKQEKLGRIQTVPA